MIHDSSFHRQRRLGVGGSDVGPIMGLSPWATPLEVYLEKIGERLPDSENHYTEWGKRLEPVIRQAYADRTNREVLLCRDPIVHPKHEFMRANLDGRTLCGRIFEAKTARVGEDWGEEGSDEVPLQYVYQVQHYMAITGYEVADIAVLIAGSDFRIYEVRADREIHDMLVEVEAEFWQRVVDRRPPDPINTSDALLQWGRFSKSKSVIAGDAEIAAINELRRLQFEYGRLKGLIEDQKLVCMAAMGDAERLVHVRGGTLATWKTQRGPYGETRPFKVR